MLLPFFEIQGYKFSFTGKRHNYIDILVYFDYFCILVIKIYVMDNNNKYLSADSGSKNPCSGFPLKKDDDLAIKLIMLYRYYHDKIRISKLIIEYGISRAGFYIIKNRYEKYGTGGLIKKKTGPKRNYVRTEQIKNLVIRYKYLDPRSSGAVIAQKLNQQGYKISVKSVERIISELRLEKKTPTMKD